MSKIIEEIEGVSNEARFGIVTLSIIVAVMAVLAIFGILAEKNAMLLKQQERHIEKTDSLKQCIYNCQLEGAELRAYFKIMKDGTKKGL